MTCGQCKYFDATKYKNWGGCVAPLPAWVGESECKNTVWTIEDHPQNYAHSCELFVLANLFKEN